MQTGIEDHAAPETFSVYPNPATGGIVNISFSNDWAGEDAVLSVNSISGQMICSDIIQMPDEGSDDFLFLLNDQMKPGIYILTVSGENGIEHAKLIIK